VLARRRPLAAALAFVAVLSAVRAVSLPPTETVEVLVAADDLAGGTRLDPTVLETAELAVDSVPAGATRSLAQLEGRTLASPLRRGEPVTDVRLVAPGLLDGYPGTVAAPVRIADPAVARLLSVGDEVDLVAVPPGGGDASVVAEGAPVVAVPRRSGDDELVGGALVVVAVPERVALSLVEASVVSVLAVVLSS
jgi:Flp pilus assembly protein CpaB